MLHGGTEMSFFNPLTPTLGGREKGIWGHPYTLGREESLHSLRESKRRGASLLCAPRMSFPRKRESRISELGGISRPQVAARPRATSGGHATSTDERVTKAKGEPFQRLGSLRPRLARLWAAPGIGRATPPKPPRPPALTAVVSSPFSRRRPSRSRSWDSLPESQDTFRPGTSVV